jgi:hypothetical protein
VPLSPNLGNSMDDLNFDAPVSTFTAPSNVTEGDLNDSILGGELEICNLCFLFIIHAHHVGTIGSLSGLTFPCIRSYGRGQQQTEGN